MFHLQASISAWSADCSPNSCYRTAFRAPLFTGLHWERGEQWGLWVEVRWDTRAPLCVLWHFFILEQSGWGHVTVWILNWSTFTITQCQRSHFLSISMWCSVSPLRALTNRPHHSAWLDLLGSVVTQVEVSLGSQEEHLANYWMNLKSKML